MEAHENTARPPESLYKRQSPNKGHMTHRGFLPRIIKRPGQVDVEFKQGGEREIW